MHSHDLTEQVARWLRDWDTDYAADPTDWDDLDGPNRAVYLSGAGELIALIEKERGDSLPRVGRFEEMLAGEDEQFDGRSVLLASIVDYTNAPSATAAAAPAAFAGVEWGWLSTDNVTAYASPTEDAARRAATRSGARRLMRREPGGPWVESTSEGQHG